MRLTIAGHRWLVKWYAQQKPVPNLIYITGPDNPWYDPHVQMAVNACPNKLVLMFDDIEFDIDRYVKPEIHHLEEALKFAEGLDELVVSCHAGVSRSSATAFAIALKYMGLEEAFAVIDPQLHSPNRRIVQLAGELLNYPDLEPMLDGWVMANTGRQALFEKIKQKYRDKLVPQMKVTNGPQTC